MISGIRVVWCFICVGLVEKCVLCEMVGCLVVLYRWVNWLLLFMVSIMWLLCVGNIW